MGPVIIYGRREGKNRGSICINKEEGGVAIKFEAWYPFGCKYCDYIIVTD
jgi:hypothetical protein